MSLSIFLKNATSNSYKLSLSNKESDNEPILESNTDHIDSENEMSRCQIRTLLVALPALT